MSLKTLRELTKELLLVLILEDEVRGLELQQPSADTKTTQELPGDPKAEYSNNMAGKSEWEHRLVLCGMFKLWNKPNWKPFFKKTCLSLVRSI